MNKWRPEGWHSPNVQAIEVTAYEDGADAILEKLRHSGLLNSSDYHIKLLTSNGGSLIDTRDGKWVFIPAEKTE